MKLQHTLGGLQGLGPVDFQKKVFVEKWETRIFGIHTAMMALSTHLENSLPDYSMDEVPTTFICQGSRQKQFKCFSSF